MQQLSRVNPPCWRQRDLSLALKRDNFAYVILNDTETRFYVIK